MLHTNNQECTHTHTHTVYVCHVKIEANEIEYLTQSRNPTGSILSQSYYSVYYICNGTTALKKITTQDEPCEIDVKGDSTPKEA